MKKMTGTLLSLAALVAGLFLYTACETSSTDDPRGISVSPSSASLAPGQSIVLTAEGGWNYQWTVGNESLGSLTKVGGNQATYYAKNGGGMQVITVTAKGGDTGSSSSTSSTNTPTTTTTSSASVQIFQ